MFASSALYSPTCIHHLHSPLFVQQLLFGTIQLTYFTADVRDAATSTAAFSVVSFSVPTYSTYNIEEKKVRIPKKKPFSGSNFLIPEGK